MKVYLLHPDRDFDWGAPTPPEEPDLTRDLGLDTLYAAMGGEDAFLRDVARHVLLARPPDPATVTYRQEILRDWQEHPDALRRIYTVAVEALEGERRIWPGFLRSPDSVMYRAVQAMELFTGSLRQLARLRDEYAGAARSAGLRRFLDMLAAELDDAFFQTIEDHLRRLRFKGGVLVSVRLGQGCKNTEYVLRRPNPKPGWRSRLTAERRPSYTYRIPDRDDAGARALAEMRERGINLAADALARSADHILSFFTMLRRELGFYLGCVNLHDRLTAKGEPLCYPTPRPQGHPYFACRGLYDPCLSLRRDERAVGNDLDADGVRLIVITGANEGGKSTFLRSVGLAQLMTQAGMYAPAESFTTDIRARLLTHFRREEDTEMESGKLDEELARMSTIADRITSNGMVLFNESFAATNEREGSQIALQVLGALVDSGVKVVIVTHLYDLAHRLHEQNTGGTAFLRAERQTGGARTYRLRPGRPLPTGFGEDLYQRVFHEPARTQG